MKGRKPTPTVLKLLNGNPGCRPLPKNEPKPQVGLPEAPDTLSADARPYWESIGRQLLDVGVMTRLDAAALAMYCEVYARWIDANQKLAQYGCVVKGPKDNMPHHSPYLRVANDCFQQMRFLLGEFGLTPASRARIHAAPKEETENPFAKIDRMRNS
jgi:P27 family predicted phage terminase small subunit